MDNTNIHNPYDSFSSYSSFYKRAHNTDWTDIVLQPYPYTTHYTQGMSFIIRELLPDQQYEAKVIARLLSILINICFAFCFCCFSHKRLFFFVCFLFTSFIVRGYFWCLKNPEKHIAKRLNKLVLIEVLY